MGRLVADIVIDGAIGSFDKRYCYLLPQDISVSAGSRVVVPFGNGNIKKQGMIMSVYEAEETDKLKEILSVTDKTPVLNGEMIMLCEWLHEHIFCTYFDVIKAILPAGLNYRLSDFYSVNTEFASPSLLDGDEIPIYEFIAENGEVPFKKINTRFENSADILLSLTEKQAVFHNMNPVRVMGDLTDKYVELACEQIPDDVKLTKRQQEIAELVEISGCISVKELEYFTGVTVSVINALEKKGVLRSFQKEKFRMPYYTSQDKKTDEIKLTDEQQAAFDGLKAHLVSEKAHTDLLYGVTGSGKTQVFLRLTDEAVKMGRGVIVMVPEIALTPQMMRIFTQRYGNKVAVFHSAMSLGQRMDEYKRIKQGRASIAIGTRSAVFAPFENLGLIVVDEEQEHTYKSEKSPRFSAKEVAKFRAAYHKGLLCLASATPSLESYSLALAKKYGFFQINKRYGNAVLPKVNVVDMKKELKDGNTSNISRQLCEAIDNVLKEKKQAIILLNRRGHNTYVSCPSCNYVEECPNCSISLTYHSANKRLMCHYCGYSKPVDKKCPVCSGEHLNFSGAGTQKIEEELKLLFENARILRLDADSTSTRNSYSEKLSAFSRGEYDILLGTQMVAKGLDFPSVTLVGVIGADRALYSDDYRGYERTFSLITQVIGRAGRATDDGFAIVQTADPSDNTVTLAKNQDYKAFYDEEILVRKAMIYPPFCDICMLCVQSSKRETAKQFITGIFNCLKEKTDGEYSDVKLIILGPCAANVPRVNGKYRFRMIIKCKNSARFRELLRTAISLKHGNDINVFIDINPETVI